MSSLPDNYDELTLDEKLSLLHKFGGTGEYSRGYNNALFACRKVILAHEASETLKNKPTYIWLIEHPENFDPQYGEGEHATDEFSSSWKPGAIPLYKGTRYE